ncbi:hypothetical protein GCM10022286_05870 [Gryllotalpicola daejeonensis]|uniref:Uncharacterized protein n=1 Tax=Gryllotalpicola daejeonensis TaxID=993087 RepID=A0ABP7ZFF6_9MICO
MTNGFRVMLTALGWVLLEHLVAVDAWAHTSSVTAIDPATAVATLALVCAFSALMAHLGRHLLRTLPRAVVYDGLPRAGDAGRQVLMPRSRPRTAGAIGARAPAVPLVG